MSFGCEKKTESERSACKMTLVNKLLSRFTTIGGAYSNPFFQFLPLAFHDKLLFNFTTERHSPTLRILFQLKTFIIRHEKRAFYFGETVGEVFKLLFFSSRHKCELLFEEALLLS